VDEESSIAHELDRNKVAEPFLKRPHVYILGAARATLRFRNWPDKNAASYLLLVLLQHCGNVVGLRPILEGLRGID